MNWILMGVGLVLLVFALLVARGMYVIGSGSEGELEARKRMSGSTPRTGWNVLYRLRNGDIPVINTIEEKLGLGDDDE